MGGLFDWVLFSLKDGMAWLEGCEGCFLCLWHSRGIKLQRRTESSHRTVSSEPITVARIASKNGNRRKSYTPFTLLTSVHLLETSLIPPPLPSFLLSFLEFRRADDEVHQLAYCC